MAQSVTLDLVQAVLQSLDYRYEIEKMSLHGAEDVEIRLFNQMTGEQSARLEFTDGAMKKLDYWDKDGKSIRTVEWD